MRFQQTLGLSDVALRGIFLLGGVQLDAAAFGNGFGHGTVNRRSGLSRFGQYINQAAMTQQQFRNLILESL
ncbi:hypothetical protein D3C74_390990 [compost metagenome]